VIRQKCSQALHILDRFHIVAKMNKALDDVRAAESRRMAQEGHEPLLKKSRWCVLKRKENLTANQQHRLRDLTARSLINANAGLFALGELMSQAILGKILVQYHPFRDI
jgi:transposase